MADKEVLIEIKVDNAKAQQSITEQTRKIDLLKKSNDKLKKTNKELATQGSVTAKERSKNNEEIAKNNIKISEANKVRKRAINVQKSEIGSLTNMRTTLARLTDQRNKDLTVGSEAFDKANIEINKLSKTIKEAEQGGDDFRRSVGKYPGTFKEAAGAMAGFGGATDGASGAVDTLGKVIRLNPIGILVSLILAMVAAFARSEEGAKKLKIIMAVLNSIFKDFVSLLAEGGKTIVGFFEDPLGSIKSFGNAIQNFVIAQVETLLQGLGKLGDAFKLLFEGEFSAAAKTAADGFNDVVRGANPLIGITEKLVEKGKEYGSTVVDNAKKSIELEEANYRLARSLLSVEKQVIALQGQEEILKRTAEDATKSFKEQEEAQKELENTQKARFALQQNILQQQVNAIKVELSLAKSRGDQLLEIQQRLNEKQKELLTNQNEQRSTAAENLQITAQRNQDIWEQELDFIIDVGEKRRVAFEEQALNENNSLDKRKEGLSLYDANLKQFLDSQRKSFEEEGLTEEEFNRLLGIADPAELAQAITDQATLSEIEKNRLREVFIEFENAEIEKNKVHAAFAKLNADQEIERIEKEESARKEADKKENERIKKQAQLRKQAAQGYLSVLSSVFNTAGQIAGNNFKLQKAFGIAEAVVNTARGVSQALGSAPPPLSFVTAGAVAAAGAVQVANIARTTPSTGGNISVGATPTTTTQPQADTSAADNAAIQQAALEAGIAAIGISVSVTEINDAQNNVSVAESNSTIGN